MAGAGATASFPNADGQLSTTAVMRIVRPIMLRADVAGEQAHPHALRHTFGRLDMAAAKAQLSRLRRIMGHASPETTSRYVHPDDHELAAEHRRIERLQRLTGSPAARSVGGSEPPARRRKKRAKEPRPRGSTRDRSPSPSRS